MSAAPSLNSALTVTIEIVRGPHKGFVQTFQQNKWTAGRGPENDLVLAQDLKVSRNHVEVQCTGAQVFVRNISQKNIMMIDGLLAVEAIMKPESVVQIGESFIRFKFDRPVEKTPLRAVPATQANPPASAKQVPAVAGMNTAVTAGGGRRAVGMPGNPGGGAVGFPGAMPGRPKPPPAVELPLFSHPKFRFYAMIVGIGVAVLWFLNSEVVRKPPEQIRGTVAVTEDMAKSDDELKAIRESMQKKGVDTPQFRLAEAQFIRGFRDYQNGQYARAMEAFQSARSFYPDHELATHYWSLAKRKQDERIQIYMLQGRRYKGVQNYRLCRSAFATVVKMVKNDKDPIYQEALRFHDECMLKELQK